MPHNESPEAARRLQLAMYELGVTPQRIRGIQSAPSFEEAGARLDQLKSDVKKAWKKKALELHPDKTGNDPYKTDRFKMLLSAVEQVDKFCIARPRPRPRPRVRFVHFTNSTTSVTDSSNVSVWWR